MKKELVAELRQELKRHADERYRQSVMRFFREPIDLYGVRTQDARRISKEFFARVRALPKQDIFDICELLHDGAKYEDHSIPFGWADRLSNKLEPSDFPRLERWLKTHVSNWAACDTLCTGALGSFLLRFPQFLPKARKWAGSRNRWVRRGAAVALIPSGRREQALTEAYAVADALLLDEDDMVQKGYGWLLKELSNRRPKEVFEFVMERRATMPRTALRYAIEKLPPALKKQAMAKPA
jgi:3-methyladenine DNA glycosylase AlkD